MRDLREHRLVRSCTIRVMPRALAQQRLRRAPVCVLHVFRATPDHPRPVAEPDKTPIVRAFVHEERLARADAVDVDAVRLEVVGEGCST